MGEFPFPQKVKALQRGHAVVAVGYNHDLEIENWRNGQKTKGALLIRNSWGEGWGNGGYGGAPVRICIEGDLRAIGGLCCVTNGLIRVNLGRNLAIRVTVKSSKK